MYYVCVNMQYKFFFAKYVKKDEYNKSGVWHEILHYF